MWNPLYIEIKCNESADKPAGQTKKNNYNYTSRVSFNDVFITICNKYFWVLKKFPNVIYCVYNIINYVYLKNKNNILKL